MLRPKDLEKLRTDCGLLGLHWNDFTSIRLPRDLEQLQARAKTAHRESIKQLHTDAENQKKHRETVAKLNGLRDLIDSLEPSDFAHMQSHSPPIRPHFTFGAGPEQVLRDFNAAMAQAQQAAAQAYQANAAASFAINDEQRRRDIEELLTLIERRRQRRGATSTTTTTGTYTTVTYVRGSKE